MQTLIVFSHLRWGFVYQRPQQLMSRLARHYRVVFVEEPVQDSGPPRLLSSTPARGVEVLCPHTPIDSAGFSDAQLPLLRQLLADYIAAKQIKRPLLWFYTPMALPLAEGLEPEAIVYDCMDELSAFVGAPRQLHQRELALLKAADLVLTGGPSLYEARRDSHPNLHCLPSAVDAEHFSPARLQPGSPEAGVAKMLHETVGKPRIGFFGVIDERMDLGLVEELADARPQWHWVLAGPVVKIDARNLPRRPNLHWLGMQPYALLPYLAAQWDVCMMPFALNSATRFISPTKTLEYLAAGKPVVSTAVRDVGQLYGDVVHVVHSANGFVAACEQLLAETPDDRQWRESIARQTVQRMSWDRGVALVVGLLSLLSQRAPAETSTEATADASTLPVPAPGEAALATPGLPAFAQPA
jgi:UDP-galactopyranose mutase